MTQAPVDRPATVPWPARAPPAEDRPTRCVPPAHKGDPMRKSTFVLMLAALLMVALAAPASASSSMRPFKGSVAGEVTFVPVPMTTCPAAGTYLGGLRTDAAATGTASHLGLVSMTTRHCTPNGDTIAGGTGSFVAANGDEIYFDYGGTAPFPGPTTTVIVADTAYTITGGTGRFQDAHGGGQLTGYVNFEGFGDPAWAARWVWSGTIGY